MTHSGRSGSGRSGPEHHGTFQDPPRLRDEWQGDVALRRALERLLPADVRDAVTPGLAALGVEAATTLRTLADRLDDRRTEPHLVPFDAWGRRIDRVETSPWWDELGRAGQRHGTVAAAYDPTHGAHARVHQAALAVLYAPSSAMYACPLAMTDGAARTLLDHADPAAPGASAHSDAVARLTSSDPDVAWTSGQWMTERAGGSDVGRSETVAHPQGDGTWTLTGVKWFTSAVTADMALALARPAGGGPGGSGLAVFHVPLRAADGTANGVRVLRLKDKLGTRQMPTAELALEDARATLVGPDHDGTRTIAPMLRVTRLWNSATAVGFLRRGLALARDHATRRVAFGRPIIEQPAHRATLAALRVTHESALQLTLLAAVLSGRAEAGVADADERAALDVLVPVTKLVTGRQAVAGLSEAIEAFGGAGYVEDTHLPALLRDAHVLPIWEGTTDVLALDALRGQLRGGGLDALVRVVAARAATLPATQPAVRSLAEAGMATLTATLRWLADADADTARHAARRVALTVGRSVQAVELALQAAHDLTVHGDARSLAVARHHVADGLDLLPAPGRPSLADDAALAADEPLPADVAGVVSPDAAGA